MGDSSSAVNHFEESIEFLMKLPMDDDLEVFSTLLFFFFLLYFGFAKFVNHFLKKLLLNLQITHTLSVSLNKIGDLKYYDGDLQAARSYYLRALNVRRDAMKHHPNAPSQVSNMPSCYFSFTHISLAPFFINLACYL